MHNNWTVCDKADKSYGASLLLALFDLLEEGAVLVDRHVAGAAASALATLGGRGRLGANRLLAL